MKYNQIETIRRVLVRKFKRHSFILCQLNSFFCFTKKKKNSRMGKGSGPLNSLEYIIKPGMVLFKILSYNYNISLISIKKIFKQIKGNFTFILKK